MLKDIRVNGISWPSSARQEIVAFAAVIAAFPDGHFPSFAKYPQ